MITYNKYLKYFLYKLKDYNFLYCMLQIEGDEI